MVFNLHNWVRSNGNVKGGRGGVVAIFFLLVLELARGGFGANESTRLRVTERADMAIG